MFSRTVAEERILRDDPDRSAKRREIEVAHVDAVDQDARP